MVQAISGFFGIHRWLSNFWPSPLVFTWFGQDWQAITSEHAYQAHKAQTKADVLKILSVPTPKEAKHLGKVLAKHPLFDEYKLDIMLRVVRHKFQQNSDLGRRLLATGDAELVERNQWHDCFWGRCDCPQHKLTGTNNLGKILMQVRAELRK
jgi:ribA/ribD-fused uncharacterized protein